MPDPVLFPLAPDPGAATVRETIAYSTDVLQAYGGSEQRIARRVVPALGLRYAITGADVRAAQLGRHLLGAAPETGWLVPWWPWMTRLGAGAAAGATHLSADLSDLPVATQDGGFTRYLLWRSPFEHEAVVAADVSDTGIDLEGPLAATWGARTVLVPLLLAHLDDLPAGDRLGYASSRAELAFEAALVTGLRYPAGASEMYARDGYLGLDVLTEVRGSDSAPEQLARRIARVEADAGRVVWDSQDAAAGVSRAHALRLPDRAAAARLRRFHAAQLGAWRPFWAPTFDDDLVLASAAAAAGNALVVHDTGYSDLLEPTRHRSHLAVRLPSGTWQYLEVGEHDHDPSGVVTLELWTPGPDEDLPAGHPLSVLRHCRLASDALELDWYGLTYAESALQLVELPADAPTGVLT